MEAIGHAQTMCVGLRVPLSVHLRACMRAPAPLSEASGMPSQTLHPAHGSSPCLAGEASGMSTKHAISARFQPVPCGPIDRSLAWAMHAHHPGHQPGPCRTAAQVT
ncbi:hypothetical protein I3842_16G090400 [Carya illinoinensis]|uniref:Uncharacterized protein n=1 Tax=Carya illinoinensis TaxID=32201 RepID=A0A922AAC0_CARIL|nr:hypothetical protein I3842_16G090400 [Carya illinoinensis]